MPDVSRELIVFPTGLAMRRYQQEQALSQGWVDASGHTTFARLRKLCLPYAPVKGRAMRPARELLLRKEVVEIASGHYEGEAGLGDLSAHALSDVLQRLVMELSLLPDMAQAILEWLGAADNSLKLRQLGTLANLWRARVKSCGYADPLDVNLAILRLLKGPREKWPPQLRDCRRVTFRAVRWFNPFEEACVTALNRKLNVRVETALPSAHAEMSADRLGQRIRAEIMTQPWAVWAEDLGDALAVDSPDVLQLADAVRISFSRSAGAYGEIEDLARRICWHLERGEMPAHRIALVVPDIGTVQDIIPHVFSRFRIPYYFRRGRPVLSSPCVKAFLAWLAFPLRMDRDVLIDLVRNPAILFENREEEVARLLRQPPRLDRQTGKPVAQLKQIFQPAHSGRDALKILNEWIIQPDDHFNREALGAVTSILEEFDGHELPPEDLIELLEALLADTTVKPRDSHEQGVWILNPHDAVGLEFDLVLFAGLNEGVFPGVPQQDALLNDGERYRLRKDLEEQGRALPKMALPEAAVLFEQESVLFLSALGMAREQLIFSCQAVDQEGVEKSESDYFSKLWSLAGWGARDRITPGPYDEWRMEQPGEENIFSRHLKKQQDADPEDRRPMPGESFLPVIPLPLCRAEDEALQTAVAGGTPSPASADSGDAVPPAALDHLVAMLDIEAERDTFLETSPDERAPSVFCGHIPHLQDKIAEWFASKEELSPTALETLAQCRYRFLLERIMGLEEERAMDDMPDPLDRGTLIHSILHEIYQAIAGGELDAEDSRCWAVKTAEGWIRRSTGGADAVPLVTLLPGMGEAYEVLARQVADRHMDRAALGHPGVWSAERDKIMETVLNLVRYDVETCAGENRYPALFELKFGGESAVDLNAVRLRGKIDRVDLMFEDTGRLKRIRVLDYKGTSRARTRREEYIDEIRRNLDCQLPVYAFAAQQHLFGEQNTPAVNAMTEAGYLFCQRKYDEIGKSLSKSLLALDEEGLTEGFLQTLHDNIQRLKAGDFAVDPLIEGYNDYQSLCRTEAVAAGELESVTSNA